MQNENEHTNDQQFEVLQKNLKNERDVETLDNIVSTLKNLLNEYMSSNDDVEEKFDRFYFIKIAKMQKLINLLRERKPNFDENHILDYMYSQ